MLNTNVVYIYWKYNLRWNVSIQLENQPQEKLGWICPSDSNLATPLRPLSLVLGLASEHHVNYVENQLVQATTWFLKLIPIFTDFNN